MEGKLALVLLVVAVPPLWASAGDSEKRDVQVDGYTRKDGTYVPEHHRTAPNQTKNDNWSTKGNENPYTGKKGSEEPYKSPYETHGTKSK